MRRILHLHEASEQSGTENVVAAIIEHLDRSRYEPLLACPPGPLAQHVAMQGISHIPFTFRLRRLKTPAGFPVRAVNPLALAQKVRESFRVERIIRDQQIDLVHTHSLSAHLVGLFAARRAKRPIIWHIHVYMPSLLYQFTLPDLMIFVSHAVRQAANPNVPAAKARTIHNGVDLSQFNPQQPVPNDVRKEFDIRPDQPLVALIGHIDPIKGQRELLEAWPQVLAERPDARLLLVGKPITFAGPDYMRELQRLITHLGIQHSAILAGFRSDIVSVLHAIDVLVSFTMNDTLSIMVIEAMAMQKAIIGANSGGLPELIHSGESGLLVNNDDIDGLARAIKTLLDDPEKRYRFGIAARRDAMSKFSIVDFINNIQAAYDELA
ncbi:MAG: glycosyltransferase family 4 protein [Anaerolineae bacterium]|nr:glycosyltransferase family 4 protein [Anaerolineae bacterium]